MQEQITISLWNLPPEASSSDMESFVRKKVSDVDPDVKPILHDPRFGKGFTTVTLTGKTRRACISAYNKLAADNILCIEEEGQNNFPIGISKDFLGITILAGEQEHPDFDFIFVHGLSGHAYKTFNCEAPDHRHSKMWARDLLPQVLDCQETPNGYCNYNGVHKHGRYSTFGYQAKVLDPDDVPVRIEDSARALLNAISLLRPKGNPVHERPLFFVCHSLGSLIVCQVRLALDRAHLSQLTLGLLEALLLAQQSDEHGLHKLNTQSGECVAKGIAFFGTPFQGSRLASFAGRLSFLLRVLPVNMSFIDHLRLKNATVNEIVDEFDALIRRMKLPLLIFHEQKKIRVFKILKFRVTEKHSAFGKFAGVLGQARPHDGSGAILKTWGPPHGDSVGMTAHIAGPAANFSNSDRPTLFFQYARREANSEESIYNPSMSMFFLEDDVSDPFIQQFRAFEKDIQCCESFDAVDADALDETCEWIEHRRAFQDWRDIQKNSVLILEGAAGIGKSVLAKSIIDKLVKDKSAQSLGRNTVAQAQKESNTSKQDVDAADQAEEGKDTGGLTKKGDKGGLVLSFFSSRSGRGNSPLSLLRHLMNQLLQLDPRALKALFRKLGQNFSTARDLQSSWELFRDACLQSSYGIYCIIDGLDECLKHVHSQPTSDIDGEMVQFLRRVCAIADGHMGTQGSNLFKTLITTRPKAEVSLAAEGKNIIYRITNIDVTPGVEKLVRKEVQEFAVTRGIPSETVEDITERIIQRSGSLYLWARAFLEFIRKPDYQLGTRTGMMEGLDQFNLKNYDDVYDEALHNILPASRKALGKLMIFLYYSRAGMNLAELTHVPAIEPDDPSPSNFSGRIHGSLRCFTEQSCGALLQIIPINTTQAETKAIVTFRHQSVPEFLARLSPRDSPDYSCSPEATELNNCYLALLCLRYLILWRQQEVSREEIDQSDGDKILALIKKSPFLLYAACGWDSHVRMAGAEIQPHIAPVNQFLNIPTVNQLGQDYEDMFTIRTRFHYQKWSDSWSPRPAENFLATFNLVNILDFYLHPYSQPAGYQKALRRFLKKIMPFSRRGKRLRKVNRSNTIDIRITDRDGNTMLHNACACGSYETAEYLLICGADGSLQNNDGDTPFSLAIEKGHESIAQLLLEEGESHDETLDERQVTMLHSACSYGMTSIAQYLLARGADPNVIVEA